MLEKLRIDDFKDRIGETFEVTPQEPEGAETMKFELQRAETTEYGDPAEWEKEHGRVPFSLEFQSGADRHVPQQIFDVSHGDLGDFQLFMVPLGPDAEGHRYEAIFS